MSERYFKALTAGGHGTHQRGFQWPLSRGKRPGKWLPPIKGELQLCANGYHVINARQLIDGRWLQHPIICEVEVRGDVLAGSDKTCVREARIIRRLYWDGRIARLFACDCAWHVLKIYEKQHPKDKRVRKCIQVARRFANGKATCDELDAAADAAWDAADAADAARDAAARDAAAAAWDAARDAAAADAAWAARNAARDAARDAARAARGARGEQRWQEKRLLEYLEGKRGQ